MNFLAQKRKQILLRESPLSGPDSHPFNDAYFKQLAKLTGTGGWSIDFNEKQSFLDQEARRILKVPKDYIPSLRFALDFYAPENHVLALETYEACREGQPFALDFKMLTYYKNPFWAKVVGTPIFDSDREIIGIQIVFQDINEAKLKEIALEKSLEIAQSQNARLFNFAEMISHHLRSHASNLELTIDLIKSATSKEEEKELGQNVVEISKSLNVTVSHLNKIIGSQIKGMGKIRSVSLADTLKTSLTKMHKLLQEHEVEIYSDFSEVPTIEYIPEYLENYFTNLVANAIHYRHPDRTPSIDIFSYYEENEICLMIKDNGMGIDLERHGKDLFGLYKTFHNRPEAIGIDLFIVKNQVESLRGIIEVESVVGNGTTFRIRL
jgi:signal transduction histidine kinase